MSKKKLREGYAIATEDQMRAVKRTMGREFLVALGFDDGWCTLCYARKPDRNCDPCVVGDNAVIMPAHIATIIKINATKGENHD